MITSGTLFIISAPSGAGKTSLVSALKEATPNISVSISHTTRPMRPGEEDGIDYHFVDEAKFENIVSTSGFLEKARVFSNFYGTDQNWVKTKLAEGKDVILEIDWQGANQVRHLLPESISIFVLPPSRKALENRLRNRGQDEPAIIAQRLSEATEEMSHYTNADYLVVNDDFAMALTEIQAIITATRLASNKQKHRHHILLRNLLAK